MKLLSMESSLRLRLVFEDRKILSDSQRSGGLKRSWVLVNRSHETISELSDYLVRSFDLRDSCPDGLILSIDGFVLPCFESTSILKENDVISVKKKRRCPEIARVDSEMKSLEHVNGDVKLLAQEEFENESGGYRSESEEAEPEILEDIEDTPKKKKKKTKTVSKKRKASKKLDLSNDRKKRRKSDTIEQSLGVPGDVHKKIEPVQNRSSHQDVLLLKSTIENVKSSDTQNEVDYSSNSDFGERKKSGAIQKSSDQVLKDGKSNGASSPLPNGTKKFPSRSTRRRKLKRQWLREQKLKEKEMQLSIADDKLSWRDKGKSVIENQHPNDCKLVEDHPQPEESDDEEGDIVPIVVRPGHIRFEPYDKEDAGHATQKHETLVENFQWNGVTNKRKGQKWGTEKAGSYKRSDQKNLNPESSYAPVVEEQTAIDIPVDFDKLTPCTALPEIGDTVAYRLIELSSSWTPELSPFRVGKISKIDVNSDRITLVQVPEYPIGFNKDDDGDESAAKSNMSLYGDDGSLEIDYPSLVDCRIMKHANPSAPKPVSQIISRATAGNQGPSSSWSCRPNSSDEPKGHKPNTEGASSSWSSWPSSSKKGQKSKKPNSGGASSSWTSLPNSDKDPKAKQINETSQENGKVNNSWEELCDTLSAKKAELAKENGWGKNASTSQSSWSYRALRGSAMGPTIARLRAQNKI